MSKASDDGLGERTKRTLRKARKLDRKAALDQRARGLSTTEIANIQCVAASTVRRFMDRMKPELAAVEEFKSGRADALARIQGKSLDLQERIIDSMTDHVLETLAPHQKNGLLMSVNTVFGTAYDKERLERGKSTQNIGLIAKMMGDSLSRIGNEVQPDNEATEAEATTRQ
ncbi:MAG: hypothetical protein GDA68_13045 [Nitrospira sp. CR2.1]|nr:hypothetical protein [Nitrospira sp. CR2.1]